VQKVEAFSSGIFCNAEMEAATTSQFHQHFMNSFDVYRVFIKEAFAPSD